MTCQGQGCRLFLREITAGVALLLPLRDTIRSRSFPYVNTVAIVLCVYVFFQQVQDTAGVITQQWSLIPARITQPAEELVVRRAIPERTPYGIQQRIVEVRIPDTAIPPLLTIFSSTFLHGSFIHLLGNMWFLYIFGDNVEDRLGHGRYAVFYLAAGGAAGVCHLVTDLAAVIPTIGASGAVAGVMGAYMKLFPRATVVTLIPIWIIPHIIELPASLFLGIWFLFQVWNGSGAIAGGMGSGIAWWAHIGGFSFGWAFVSAFHRINPESGSVRVIRRPTANQSQYRRW